MSQIQGRRIHITGVVQGVGFRPFVYNLARRHRLTGWVRNSSSGVDIEADGRPELLQAFVHDLKAELPPLATIDSLEIEEQPANGFVHFEIVASAAVPGAFQPVSPDVATCPDCLQELFDPQDRRYRYPFINCTNCGPRFTIIRDIPYDRPQTTMAPFPMCADCEAEYHDPLNRRFHAQPVACARCGPRVWLTTAGGEGPTAVAEEAIVETRRLLEVGWIIAVKGLGGFHLACDATNAAAVAMLRRRKLRVDKPFAVMVADLAAAATHCYLDSAAKRLLQEPARPIVLLPRRPESTIAAEVAPNQQTLGLMLPYTPLHHLLLEARNGRSPVLVMTSGNLSEEPIAHTNETARAQLADLADAFLLHDRAIHIRCDDSVMRSWEPVSLPGDGQPETVGNSEPPPRAGEALLPIRRSRGYAPFPVRLPCAPPPVLATGGELKNTFCLTRDDYAFLSHHIGDLSNYETLRAFEQGVAHFERLFRSRPELLACDQHPDYLAGRYAQERATAEGLSLVRVQHHHAHIAACLAEHRLDGRRPVIGVALDGTGYGDDATIWGGEFLLADYQRYERAAYLRPVRLPGGDRGIREPWRMALSWLYAGGLDWADNLPPVAYAHSAAALRIGPLPVEPLTVLRSQLASGLNAPLTSSMGRLFDAVAALLGIRQVINYEAQAAIELEAMAAVGETAVYPFNFEPPVLDPTPMFARLVAEWQAGVAVALLSARFHNTVSAMVTAVCRHLSRETGLREVALSGGVWQNMTLLTQTVTRLEQAGLTVYRHQVVPANDGGLALGQAAVAAYWVEGGG